MVKTDLCKQGKYMRFTLQDLTRLADYIVKSQLQHINDYLHDYLSLEQTIVILGWDPRANIQKNVPHYSLLHCILMEMRDAQNKSVCIEYFKLLKRLLPYENVDPNVYDVHGYTLLHYAATDYNNYLAWWQQYSQKHGIFPIYLMKTLLKCKANPNITSRDDHLTPLEFAIQRNPESRDVVHFLSAITVRTQSILHNSKLQFEDAYETEDGDYDIDRINRLIECKLVDPSKVIENVVPDCPVGIKQHFMQGIWFRGVSRVDEEKQVLDWMDLNLDGCRNPENLQTKIPTIGHKFYRSATFIVYNVPTMTFGVSVPGLLICRKNRNIAYWYDGQYGEEITDRGEGLTVASGVRGHYRNISEENILTSIMSLYAKAKKECKREPMDDYGVLFSKRCKHIYFAWNEGLLPYTRSDVFGIHVDPTNTDCCQAAITLRDKLGLKVAFYKYEPNARNLTIVDESLVLKSFAQQTAMVRKSPRVFA